MLQEGLCRFATEKYSTDVASFARAYVHLTNYRCDQPMTDGIDIFICSALAADTCHPFTPSLNKKSDAFNDHEDEDKGTKQR